MNESDLQYQHFIWESEPFKGACLISVICTCGSFLSNPFYFFENVVHVSYIIYLHCASLTYFFQQNSILAFVTVAPVTSFFLPRCSSAQEKVTGGTCRCWTGPTRERRSLDPTACSANSAQACLTGTGTWRCDIAHFIQSTHTHERENIVDQL